MSGSLGHWVPETGSYTARGEEVKNLVRLDRFTSSMFTAPVVFTA